MTRCVVSKLGKMLLLAINVNTEDRHRGWGRLFRAAGLGIIASLALSACNGCAFRQPLAVSCHSFSSGRVMSQGMSKGVASMGESKGVRQSKAICIIIYTENELNQLLESQE